MKNKDKKIISLMVMMTLVITMVIGPINPISIVKAEDNKSIKIKDILNEDELVSDDEKLLLSKTGEKISDNEFKVTLNIKGNNDENINLNNAIIEDTLNSGFEIVEDSIEIEGIEDKESININTDETNEKISIELGNINVEEIQVSFLVKVRDNIEAKENIEVSQETKLTYNVLENEENEENEEKVEINFPKLNINLEEVVEKVNNEVTVEENATNQAIDNIEDEIIEDIPGEEVVVDVIEDEEDNIVTLAGSSVTIIKKEIGKISGDTVRYNDNNIEVAPGEVFEIRLTVVRPSSSLGKGLIVNDYIDTSKFTYVPGYSTIDGGRKEPKITSGNNYQKNQWTIEKDGGVIIYRVKVNTNTNGNNVSVNPNDRKGDISVKYSFMTSNLGYFNSISVNIPQSTGDSGSGENINILTPEKYAELQQDNETVKITLNASQGITQTEPKDADIVLVIDASSSMNDNVNQTNKMEIVKDAVKDFCEDIFTTNTNGNVRIFITTFSYTSEYQCPGMSSTWVQNSFFTNITEVQNALNQINASGGTNTQDGIWRAANVLAAGRATKPNANQYVIFFTDGLPTQSYNGGDGKNTNNKYMDDAITEYKMHFKTWNQTESDVTHPNAKFYSIGLFGDKDDKEQAKNLLKQIQNVIDPNLYGEDNYYTEDASSITGIYNNISTEIESYMNPTATDVVIKDIVAKEFEIIKDSEHEITITDWQGNEMNLGDSNIIQTKDEQGRDIITFNIGDIVVNDGQDTAGVKITFYIKLKDCYFGVAEGETIDTNHLATIVYTQGNGTFNVPNVYIPFKKGTITIEKQIGTEDGSNQWNKLDDRQVNSDDRFSISITRKEEDTAAEKEKYTVDLAGKKVSNEVSNEAKLQFYLKDTQTDISNNKDYDLNYLTIGQYSIEELIPMNYGKQIIEVYKKNGEEWDKINTDNKFTLDKDNNEIKIIVKNTLENKSYWFDKAGAENVFNYNVS